MMVCEQMLQGSKPSAIGVGFAADGDPTVSIRCREERQRDKIARRTWMRTETRPSSIVGAGEDTQEGQRYQEKQRCRRRWNRQRQGADQSPKGAAILRRTWMRTDAAPSVCGAGKGTQGAAIPRRTWMHGCGRTPSGHYEVWAKKIKSKRGSDATKNRGADGRPTVSIRCGEANNVDG